MMNLMNDDGQPFLESVSGKQGIGKTNESFKDILYAAYQAPQPRKGIILDTNGDEYAEKQLFNSDGSSVTHRIKTIQPDEILNFCNHRSTEVRRISFKQPNGVPLTPDESDKLIRRVLLEVHSCNMIAEDFSRIYSQQSIPSEIVGALINLRHKGDGRGAGASGVTLIWHVQSLAKLNTTMRENSRFIRMHYQLSSVRSSVKNKFEDEEEIYLIAEKLINAQYASGNTRFFVYINRDKKKIVGAFSPKMFHQAVIDYLTENEKEMKPLLRKRDAQTGKLIHTYQSALQEYSRYIHLKYNGNLNV